MDRIIHIVDIIENGSTKFSNLGFDLILLCIMLFNYLNQIY